MPGWIRAGVVAVVLAALAAGGCATGTAPPPQEPMIYAPGAIDVFSGYPTSHGR